MKKPTDGDSRAAGRAKVLLAMPEISERTGGGIGRVGHSVIRLLAEKQGQGEIDYLVLALGQPCGDDERQEIVRRTEGRVRWCGTSRLRFCAAALWRMCTWADVVIFTHLGLASLLCLTPGPVRPKSMTFVHGIEAWGRLNARKRMGLRICDVVVGNTEFTARRAREIHAWFPPCRCCHLGIAEHSSGEALADWRGRLGFEPREHDIVIVGRLARGETRKGHRELIAAMEPVAAAVPDARLVIVGTGNDTRLYQELVRQSPVAGCILFTGFVPDDLLWELYRHSGIFAMPSRQEGFGLVYAEAMRAGLPCVASNCDAAQEVVIHGETGFLVDPDDPRALVDVLVRLLKDGELRRAMGRRGQDRAASCFTETEFHQRFWRIVEDLLP